MIILKDYQERVLDSLRDYFRLCSKNGRPDDAFAAIQRRNGVVGVPYLPVRAAGLNDKMPYVCLRVPTGGGKTLLACYTAGIAMDELLHAERAVVLWLVPSSTILDQTADALRDPRHPYRRALELSRGNVEVMTINEALRLSRATVDGQTVVIVSTMQCFRVEDTTGRKVYDQNGAFSEHLQNLPGDILADLFPDADGRPKPSLVNMLRIRRPIVIVDEAHNARTDLSFATLGSVKPSCIIEFTATPALTKHPSNVLHRISAAELKAADMVKLPLRVITRRPSQRNELLSEAIALRNDLERLASAEAQQTSEYIRPIMLIQAERVDACEALKTRLSNEFGIPEGDIKISTGKLDELKDIKDLAIPSCSVRYIITVEKLREGWDCPFAYVLCSLKETRSAAAIEQIVGRIMRLPRAQAKRHPDLNCAFAFSVSPSLPEVLNELREALEHNGFTPAEAERIVIPEQQPGLSLGYQPKTGHFELEKEIDSGIAVFQVSALAGKVEFNLKNGDLTIFSPLNDDETEALSSCMKTKEAKARVNDLVNLVKEEVSLYDGGKSRFISPFEKHIDFRVPLLCINESGTLIEFESTILLEHPWKLSEKDASLDNDYNPLLRPFGQTGSLDVGIRGEVVISADDQGEYKTDFITGLHQRAFQLSGTTDWTFENLVVWLDRHIDHQDIPLSESAEFLRKSLRWLMARFDIKDISLLALDRFRLRDTIEERIQQHRESERKSTFQLLLLPQSSLTVSDEYEINFKDLPYEPSTLYNGGFQFKKHYYGPKPGELPEKTATGKLYEEFQCAQYLDNHREIEFWIRNLSRKRSSFRLQTSTDWFYPDFICKLRDGRVLVVEYKGQDRYTAADAEEKRAIGAVWEARSGGRCLFVMPTEGNFAVIDQKINSRSHQTRV